MVYYMHYMYTVIGIGRVRDEERWEGGREERERERERERE